MSYYDERPRSPYSRPRSPYDSPRSPYSSSPTFETSSQHTYDSYEQCVSSHALSPHLRRRVDSPVDYGYARPGSSMGLRGASLAVRPIQASHSFHGVQSIRVTRSPSLNSNGSDEGDGRRGSPGAVLLTVPGADGGGSIRNRSRSTGSRVSTTTMRSGQGRQRCSDAGHHQSSAEVGAYWGAGGGDGRRKMSCYDERSARDTRPRKGSCFEPHQLTTMQQFQESRSTQDVRHYHQPPREWMEGWMEGGGQRRATPESPRRRLPPTPEDLRNAHHGQRHAQLPPEPGQRHSSRSSLNRTSPTPPPLYADTSPRHTPSPHHPISPTRDRPRSSTGRRLPTAPGSVELPTTPSPPPPVHQYAPQLAGADPRSGMSRAMKAAALRGRKSEGALGPMLVRQAKLSGDGTAPALGGSRGQRSLEANAGHRALLGGPTALPTPPPLMPKLPTPVDASMATMVKTTNGFGADLGGPTRLRKELTRQRSNSDGSFVLSEASSRPPLDSSLSPEHYASSDEARAADPAAYGLSPELYRDSGSSSPVSARSRSGSAAMSQSDSWSDSKPAAEMAGPQYGIGNLRFSVQYFPVRKRLRVSIMRVEELSTGLKPDQELHALVKLCIMPGKNQKQQSRVVKQSKDATFNEEFFFDNLAAEDIKKKALWVRLCHQAGKLSHKDVIIGDIELPFSTAAELMSKKEIPCLYGLRPRTSQKHGRLMIATSLETDAKRLTINVIKVEDLPKGINGSPDPYIKITVKQCGKSQTKQSRAIKNSCNAVYKEAVMFVVGTKAAEIDDLEIVLGVYDHALQGQKDDLIGQAFLGGCATEKSEIEQWKSTRDHPGREYKALHGLRLPPKPIIKPHH